MKKLFLLLFILVFGLLVTACSGGQSSTTQSQSFEKIVPDQFADVFLAGEYERIHQQMETSFRKQVTLDDLTSLAIPFNEGVQAYELQSTLPIEEWTRYVWMDLDHTRGIVGVFDTEGTIASLRIMYLETFPETDEKWTKTEFILPFKGEWLTFWGGTNELLNYHYAYPSQRYAYDFLIVKDRSSYSGNAEKNESYYAFGQEVISPADGKVIHIVNDILDNEPVGEMNANDPGGNEVIIDHGNGEYSYIAHFKHGSIIVNVGDEVKQGDLLGLSGNSGNSSEAHIHFQVSDGPDIYQANSLRIRFKEHENIKQGDVVVNQLISESR